jgi:hypothetical protein
LVYGNFSVLLLKFEYAAYIPRNVTGSDSNEGIFKEWSAEVGMRDG